MNSIKMDMLDMNILMTSSEYKKEREYWINMLNDVAAMSGFPTDYPRQKDARYKKQTLVSSLPNTVADKLLSISNNLEHALYVVLLAGTGYLLSKYTSQKDVIIGMPSFIDDSEGVYNNVLPIRNNYLYSDTYKDTLLKVRQTVMDINDNKSFPVAKIFEYLEIASEFENTPLYNTIVSLQNIHNCNAIEDEPFDLAIAYKLEAQDISISISYNSVLYSELTIKQIMMHLIQVHSKIADNPYIRLGEIDILTDSDKIKLLEEFNASKLDYPQGLLLHQLFEEQARKNPCSTALIFENQKLSYKELNEASNKVANLLRKKGAKADSIIGLMANVSVEMIIGALAILKAGAAYLPIDPEFPQNRIEYIIKDSKIELLLAEEAFECTGSLNIETLNIKEQVSSQGDMSDPARVNRETDLAYVIYTSGSTGNPKGVMIQHNSIVNQLMGLSHMFNLDGSYNHILIAPFTFDASVKHIFLALTTGGSLFLVSNSIKLNPPRLISFLADNKINIINVVPSLMNVLVEYADSDNGVYFKYVMLAGEVFTISLYNKIKKAFKADHILNIYGPTEAAVNATYYYCRGADTNSNIPIGKPLKNYKLYILDENQELVPPGVVGELCISGVGVARGYINNEKLTSEKFLPNPFIEGESLYRTGDLSRWLQDGNIEYIGRTDYQVKIAGRRIELGEIENHLLSFEKIKNVMVIDREDNNGNKVLYAYYVSDSILNVAQLREHILRKLPEYMIPSYFIHLQQMPLTLNGKIDRKALLNIEVESNARVMAEYLPPRNEIEEILINSWKRVLQADALGINDNFFELGGDSIKAIQISAELMKHGMRMDIKDLFTYQNIGTLSSYIKLDKIKAEQGIVKGEVSLTPIQHWFFENIKTDRHHWNQSVILHNKNTINIKILKQLLEKLVKQHDALRACFIIDDIKVIQKIRGLEDELFSLEYFNLLDNKDYKNAIEQISSKIQGSINLSTGPLLKTALFNTIDGDYLLVAIHHLVIDGVSWRILLEDFAAGYHQALNDEEISFQAKTTSYREWAELIVEYSNNGKAAEEMEYWSALEKTKVGLLPKDFDIESNKAGDVKELSISLNTEETDNLLKNVSRAYNTEINDILVAGLTMAINQWTQSNDILINMEGHGREAILSNADISRTVGWFTSIYPVLISLREQSDVSGTIKIVKEVLHNIPNKGVNYGILKYLNNNSNRALESDLKPEIILNYLGQYDMQQYSDEFTLSDIATGKAVSPSSERQHVLDIYGMITNGCLNITFSYNSKQYYESTIAELAENYKKNLQLIIMHCIGKEGTEITLSDLADDDITDDELSNILDYVNSI